MEPFKSKQVAKLTKFLKPVLLKSGFCHTNIFDMLKKTQHVQNKYIFAILFTIFPKVPMIFV
jgi:hypothetical protein